MEVNSMASGALPTVEPRVPTAPRQGSDPTQVKKVAREFEAMFVGMMLKSMRETVGQDKLTGGGRGEETFRSLLDQEYANEATKSGGVGLARMLEQELARNGQTPATTQRIDHAY